MGQENKQVISDLVTSIKNNPSRLISYVEDAVVIDESSSAQIVATAIKTTSANPELAQTIIDTAIAIVPKRSSEIAEAGKNAIAENTRLKQSYDEIERMQLSGGTKNEEVRAADFPEVIMKAIPVKPVELKPATTPSQKTPCS